MIFALKAASPKCSNSRETSTSNTGPTCQPSGWSREEKIMNRVTLSLIAALVFFSCFVFGQQKTAARPNQATFEEVLQAHGGRDKIAAIQSYRAEAARMTQTAPTVFFERRLIVSVDGDLMKRETIDPQRDAVQTETLTSQGELSVALGSRRELGPSASITRSTGDTGRARAVRFSVQTFGLLPILKECAGENAEISGPQTMANGRSCFVVKVPEHTLVIYVDENQLITRVDIGGSVAQFADYREVGGLRLPYVERISVAERTLFELFFSKIEIIVA